MSRITIEDCLSGKNKDLNKFKLVIIAAQRAKDITSGSVMHVKTTNKPGVAALREIAAGKIDVMEIEKNIIKNMAMKDAFDKNIDVIVDESLINRDYSFIGRAPNEQIALEIDTSFSEIDLDGKEI